MEEDGVSRVAELTIPSGNVATIFVVDGVENGLSIGITWSDDLYRLCVPVRRVWLRSCVDLRDEGERSKFRKHY